jgi:hypothetical protein
MTRIPSATVESIGENLEQTTSVGLRAHDVGI